MPGINPLETITTTLPSKSDMKNVVLKSDKQTISTPVPNSFFTSLANVFLFFSEKSHSTLYLVLISGD